MKFIKLMILMLSGVYVNALNGRYCANLFGNVVNTSFVPKYVNASANVFGESAHCNFIPYVLDKNMSISLSSNQSSCLNKYLANFGACPCPPELIYQPRQHQIYVPSVYGVKKMLSK